MKITNFLIAGVAIVVSSVLCGIFHGNRLYFNTNLELIGYNATAMLLVVSILTVVPGVKIVITEIKGN